jgi:hypothetical protein
MSTSTTPLYYASISELTGLCFAVGPTVLFAPCESDALHVVREGAPLVITAEVPHLFANFLRETIVEKRLASLGGAR